MKTKLDPGAISKLSLRNKLAFTLSLIALLFLLPGIYLSMLTIESKGSINASVPHVESTFLGIPHIKGTENKHISVNIFDTQRSILKTVHDLWERHYLFVAVMIFLFSVVVPFTKSFLVTYLFFHKSAKTRQQILAFIKSIGKWSMCDVFIVAVLLCYLSTGAASSETTKNIAVMGQPINVDILTSMHANLHTGFWCFLTYCLLSLIALQLYEAY